MWLRSDHRGVSVFVRGEFVAPRQWLIHANVSRGSGIDSAMGAASRRLTLGQLWQGIVYESRVGRHLGAVAVRVIVDGDPDIASMFAASEYDRDSSAKAPLSESSGGGARSSIAPRADGDSGHFSEYATQQLAGAI